MMSQEQREKIQKLEKMVRRGDLLAGPFLILTGIALGLNTALETIAGAFPPAMGAAFTLAFLGMTIAGAAMLPPFSARKLREALQSATKLLPLGTFLVCFGIPLDIAYSNLLQPSPKAKAHQEPPAPNSRDSRDTIQPRDLFPFIPAKPDGMKVGPKKKQKSPFSDALGPKVHELKLATRCNTETRLAHSQPRLPVARRSTYG